MKARGVIQKTSIGLPRKWLSGLEAVQSGELVTIDFRKLI